MDIILASKSPRRYELFSRLDLPFRVEVVNTSETIDQSLPLAKAIEKVAKEKGQAVLNSNPNSIVVCADTIVVLDGQIFGKPVDAEDAKRMLSALSGRTHQVITAVGIISARKQVSYSSISDVTFYDLSDAEILAYVDTNEPLDKAGAYGIQDKGAFLVKAIKGDYFSIMGLPIASLKRALDDFMEEEK